MRSSREPRRWSCAGDLPGQTEVDILAGDGDLFKRVVATLGEARGDELDELLGSRGARGQADRRVAREELVLERALAVDERSLGPGRPGDLDEALRVRARLGADHEDQRRAAAVQLLDRVLTVLRRVADVVGGGAAQRADVFLERVDDRSDVVERERRLGDDRDGLSLRLEPARLLGRLDHHGRLGPLAPRPDHLDMVGVTDERDQMAAVGVTARLGVHLRDEWADRVDDLQAALGAPLPDRGRDPVRREHADLAGRNLVLGLDEDRAEALEPADDVLVVDDLMADVDRRPVLLEEALDDLDRSVDARAERARSGEEDAAAAAHSGTSWRSACRPVSSDGRTRSRRPRRLSRHGLGAASQAMPQARTA